MSAPAVIGLACAASSTTPAHGFSAAAYEASTFSFTAVREDSTCYSYVQPTAQAGVATEWGVLWVAVFVTIMVVAAFAAYTAWLFRYVGFRVSPKTNEVGMQTEWQWPAKKLIMSTPIEHHEITVAPQNVLTLPHGRCFHVHGCHHTRQPNSTSQVFLLKEGMKSYRRCEVCLAHTQPRPWAARRVANVIDYSALLVDQEVISEKVLQFVGAHDDPLYAWSTGRHWIGVGCSQSCGCCRSADDEDRGSGCEPCEDLWYFKRASRGIRYRVRDYSGLWTR